MAEPHSSNVPISNHKRRKNYWEPVYRPELINKPYPEFNWDFTNTSGPKSCTCDGDILEKKIKGIASYVVTDQNFVDCDFSGVFGNTRISFKGCRFKNCDFGRSSWINVKFSDCVFEKCSFSTASFSEVQFLRCEWFDIGMSHEEMRLQNVMISNPAEFINSTYTNRDKDELAPYGRTVEYQVYRLEQTKAKISRKILGNLEKTGDDDVFYAAVEACAKQIFAAKIIEAKHNLSGLTNYFSLDFIKWCFLIFLYQIELGIVSLSGRINGWGGRIGRAVLCGLFLITFFALYFYFLGFFDDFSRAFLAALEITLLVGYTKYTSTGTPWLEQLAYSINMVLGIWWYAVFVPTMINRISRVRI